MTDIPVHCLVIWHYIHSETDLLFCCYAHLKLSGQFTKMLPCNLHRDMNSNSPVYRRHN